MSEVIVRGGTIVTVDGDSAVTTGDVASVDGELVQVGGTYSPRTGDYDVVDATGCIVMPGLVQAHVHTCQTLARGRADDMELLDWLRKLVWPYEAALDADDVRASADLAMAELLLGGTTAILDMGTVHYTASVFGSAQRSGIRATIGKVMMDEHTDDIPMGLRENTQESLDESIRLCGEWHDRAEGRLRYAFTPRFALSCTEQLMRDTVVEARKRGALLHTHASESPAEIEEVERRTGRRNIVYLTDVGLAGPDTCLAHCIWLTDDEVAMVAEAGTHVIHCPSSNLKLGSGIARIPEMAALGVQIAIAADGAPCNNNLDGFWELRLAALIHKPRAGAGSMSAAAVVRMATQGGANAIGLGDSIGSLEVGKRADLIVLETRTLHSTPASNAYSIIAYSAQSRDVRHVVVNGRVVVRDRELLTMHTDSVLDTAKTRADAVFARLGVS